MSSQISQFLDLDYWRQLLSFDFLSRDFIINIIDILVVWYLVYKLFMLVKGTKAVQLLKGVAVFIIVRIVSEIIGLHTVSWIMNQVIMYGVIAAVVIFQPEVRRGLEHLGRSSLFRGSKSSKKQEEKMVIDFDKAIQYMAKRKIGALITIEKNTGLDEYIETGIRLDADISSELLINIFIPNTPLHDGAVIVKDGKIAAACAYLPLSESNLISKEFGTRHRAAIGVSEISDSLTIIVSEETGDVSLTVNNSFIPRLKQEEYLKILLQELVPKSEKKEKKNLFVHFVEGISKGAKKK